MRNRLQSALSLAGAALAVAFLLTGCEDIVYQQTPMFNPPKDSESGFLGYFDAAAGQTTCGNCHAGKQAEWAGTKHSHAWEDLQASGHATEACNSCHTTTEYGNWVTKAAGYNAVQDSAYHDVQCEACHGPGVDHIAAAETTQPLASIAVDTAATKANGCAECHTGDHNPFTEEWSQSGHGYAGGYKAEGVRDPCANCHEGRRAIGTALAGMDPRPAALVAVKGIYLEANDPIDAAHVQPITCAVCHDPHDATNEGQLRAPVGEPDTTQLCYRCHHRENEPEPGLAPRRGAHGAQGAVWMDEEAGWKPPTWPYAERILPTHASANERGCAACHVTPFNAKGSDGTTRYYTGHYFDAIPCIDQSTGMPIHNGTCGEDQRYFGGCATSGCHGSAEAARTALEATKARLDYLTDQLWFDSNANSAMDTTDAGLLPKVLKQAVVAGKLDVMNLYDTTLTIAERAIWNAQISSTSDRAFWLSFTVPLQRSCQYIPTNCSTKGGSNTSHAAAGEGAHNPYFSEALVIETIKAIQTTYGVSGSPAMDLTLHAKAPPGIRMAVK
jgi:predicted CXXCH cytochrome family protein